VRSCDADLDASIGKLKDLNVFADQATVGGRVRQQIELALVVKGERLGDFAKFRQQKIRSRSSSSLSARWASWALRGSLANRAL